VTHRRGRLSFETPASPAPQDEAECTQLLFLTLKARSARPGTKRQKGEAYALGNIRIFAPFTSVKDSRTENLRPLLLRFKL